jgi:hypothetical protein
MSVRRTAFTEIHSRLKSAPDSKPTRQPRFKSLLTIMEADSEKDDYSVIIH